MTVKYFFEKEFPCVLPAAFDVRRAERVITPALFGMARPIPRAGEDTLIIIGGAAPPALRDGEAVIETTPAGIAIRGRDYGATMRGLMTVLLNVRIDRKAEKLYRDCGTEILRPDIPFRGVHLCCFPETTREELCSYIRLAGLLRFTHIIVEFWGTLDLEIPGVPLAWPGAMTLAGAKAMFDEARAWGLEVIPMFNHLGHAAGARLSCGKHVVLDQAPHLAPLFRANGWEWDIENEKVRALLADIRRKMIEISGGGRYFHLGCDEAYSFGYGENRAAALAGFLTEIQDSPEMRGRRGIIWGDMLQLKQDYENEPRRYSFNVTDPAISGALRDKLDRRLIIADWQYHQPDGCWKSSAAFKSLGFDVICCPWDHDERLNVRSALRTAKALSLHGVLHTTWHTLDDGVPAFVYAGLASCTGDLSLIENHTRLRLLAAEIFRKVKPFAPYREAGFYRDQIHLK